MNAKTLLGQLQLLAILEGISYISFALTMPLKYFMHIKGPNQVVGMIHGILFIAYCMWTILLSKQRRLPFKTTSIILIASLVPFMTFWVEKRILTKLK
jgi:integral membrane protein